MSFLGNFAAFGTSGSSQGSAPIPVTTPSGSTEKKTPESFVFTEDKITSLDTTEKKELLLFQWLSTLEKDLELHGDKETLKPVQSKLESLLLKFISSTAPKPSRPTYKLFARCFNLMFSRGDSRSVFDVVASLQNLLGNKKLEEVSVKIAAVHCIGAITEEHGAKVLSLFAETATILLKFLSKARDSEIPIRYACLKAIAASLKGSGRSCNDVNIKEFMRYAKNGLSDKVPLIRMTSMELMESVYLYTSQSPPLALSDYESLCLSIFKSLEGSSLEQRRVTASLVANILSLSQKPPPVNKQPIKRGILGLGESAPPPVAANGNILSVEDMISLFSTCFVKISPTARDARVGIIEAYGVTLRHLGVSFVESNYTSIAKHLIEFASHSKLTSTPGDALWIRQLAGYVLRDVIGKMLSEAGQSAATRELIGSWIKRWSPKNESSISKPVLIFVLDEVSALLQDLGPAATSVQEGLLEALFALLIHPSSTVKMYLAWTFRSLCLALPVNISRILNGIVPLLQKEAGVMTIDRPETVEKVMGYSYVISSVIGCMSRRHLYAVYEDAATLFGIATQLIKAASSGKNLRIMGNQAMIGWTIVASLMTLGPNFVGVHISQLLLIWKNVLPKPLPKDSVTVRSDLEWAYLLFSRDAALSALHAFLTYNGSELVTSDVAKRIAVCLNNTLLFLGTIHPTYNLEFSSGSSSQGHNQLPPIVHKLYERECRLKKRLFRCFQALQKRAPLSSSSIPGTPSSSVSVFDTSFIQLLKSVVDVFAPDPEKPDRFLPPGNAMSKEPPQIETVMASSLMRGPVVSVAADLRNEDRTISRVMVKDTDVRKVEELIDICPMHSLEHDATHLFFIETRFEHETVSSNSSGHQNAQGAAEHRENIIFPVPPLTACTDAAIDLFAMLFPLQNTATQETLAEHLLKVATVCNGSAATSGSGKMTIIRRAACQNNCIVAMIGVLRYVMDRKEQITNGKVGSIIRDFGMTFIYSPNPSIRSAASEILGRLLRVSSAPTFVNPVIQGFVDQIVNVSDCDVRAGSSLALGTIYSFMGGLAGGSHLRTVVSILHSLAADAHPSVHIWALHALWLTIESAGLMFGPFVNSTLSLIVKLFFADTHDIAAPTANYPGGDTNVDVYPAFGRILCALVGVIGPELQMSARYRDICFSLFDQLKSDTDPFVVVEAIRCVQNFIMFAPAHLNLEQMIPFLQRQLTSDVKSEVYQIRKASVTCLYQLTQRDAGAVLEAVVGNTGNHLETQLLALLDVETDWMIRAEIKDIIVALIKHVAPTSPSPWIELSKEILSRTSSKDAEKTATMTAQASAGGSGPSGHATAGADGDDEDDMIGGEPGVSSTHVTQTPSSSSPNKAQAKHLIVILLPRWRTRIFALSCIRLVLQTALESEVKEHGDLALARLKREQSPHQADFLVFKLVELIRVAFTASTADVNDLRLAGLYLLEDVLQRYAKTPDPDFDGHPLLEQYQAQIISALAPAFSEDSSPETVSAACSVAAFFVRSGIALDVGSISRPIKLLTKLLETVADETTAQTFVSPTATVMVTVAILNAWADLLLSQDKVPGLKAIMNPNMNQLAKLWISLLRDYARMTIEEESTGGNVGQSFQPASNQARHVYSAATSSVTLPFYRKSWKLIASAIAVLIEEGSSAVEPYLKDTSTKSDGKSCPRVFYILLGLSIESLAITGYHASTNDDFSLRRGSDVIRSHHRPKVVIQDATSAKLSTLRKLLSARFLKDTFLPEIVFGELLDLFEQLSTSDDLDVQQELLACILHIVSSNSDKIRQYLCPPDIGSGLSTENLEKALKPVFNILGAHVPGMKASRSLSISTSHELSPKSSSIVNSGLEILVKLVQDELLLKETSQVVVPVVLGIFANVIQGDKFVGEYSHKPLVILKTFIETLNSRISNVEECDGVKAAIVGFTSQLLQKALSLIESAKTSEIALSIIHDVFLAATVVLTGASRLSFNKSIEKLTVTLISKMHNSPVPSLPMLAQQGLRSLLLLSGKPDPIEKAIGYHYSRVLVVIISHRISKLAQEIHGGFSRDTLPGQLEESIKTLLILVSTVTDESQKTRLMNVVVLLLISSLLEPASTEGQYSFKSDPSRITHNFAASTLLQLASSQPQTFKAIIPSLDPSQRSKLENALKYIVSANGSSTGTATPASQIRGDSSASFTSAPPKIQLKNFAT